MAVSADGSRIYALQEVPPEVLIFDSETNELLTRIPVDGKPDALAHIDGLPTVNDASVPDNGK